MMKTKTEELLGKICWDHTKCMAVVSRECCSCPIELLEQHLAPLIAKERIIAKLREYDKNEDTEWAPKKYTVQLINGELDITSDAPFIRVDTELYSTISSWHRVIEEMPETIIEAFGWGKDES